MEDIKVNLRDLELKDKELYQCLRAEERRQHRDLEMIASESIQNVEALMLAGSVFNNKTAVGSSCAEKSMQNRWKKVYIPAMWHLITCRQLLP